MTLKKLIENRTGDIATMKTLMDHYREIKSANLKKVRLKIEVQTLDEGKLLGFDISELMIDTASKDHGTLDIYDATALRAC